MWMLIDLMSSQRSLKLLSFFKSLSLFSCSSCVIMSDLSFRALIHSSVRSNLLLIPPLLLFLFQCILQPRLTLLIFSKSPEVCNVFIHSYSEFNEHIRSLPSTLHQVDCLSPLYFFPEVLSCFIIWNIFLSLLILPHSLHIFFYVHQLYFPILEEWFYVGNIQRGSAVLSLLVTRNICSSDALIQAECATLLLQDWPQPVCW